MPPPGSNRVKAERFFVVFQEFQRCLKRASSFSRKLQGNYKVFRVVERDFKVVSMKFQGCPKKVLKVFQVRLKFQGCLRKFQGCFEKGCRVFQESFKDD